MSCASSSCTWYVPSVTASNLATWQDVYTFDRYRCLLFCSPRMVPTSGAVPDVVGIRIPPRLAPQKSRVILEQSRDNGVEIVSPELTVV
jgi:hypothetical protein